jgi:predicted N-acetyltransferase YhbS
VIRDETDADADVIGEVTEAAFRDLVVSDHTELLIVAALRAAMALISMVAERDDQVVGHIAFSPVAPPTVPPAGTASGRSRCCHNFSARASAPH